MLQANLTPTPAPRPPRRHTKSNQQQAFRKLGRRICVMDKTDAPLSVSQEVTRIRLHFATKFYLFISLAS
jgi:hypothetical protein